MLYALAMGACSMIYAVTIGQAILYAYRIGPSHTKVRCRRSLGGCHNFARSLYASKIGPQIACLATCVGSVSFNPECNLGRLESLTDTESWLHLGEL